MLRKLALAVATAGSLYSAPAMALGLGSIQLESAQNEPLQAEIVLNDIQGLALTDIQPELADNDAFQRAGIERFFFLSNLKFEPFVDDNGVSKVRVTTTQPVVEPYLSFLVELNWPSGRLLKEYTVLLDPPNVAGKSALPQIRVSSNDDAGTSQPVSNGASGSITTQATITSTSERVTATNPRPTRDDSVAPGEYRVQNGDTLWVIARDNRPDTSSINQTMVAIQRMNPNAFLNGNINLIKSGSVLDLPSADDVRRYAANQADQLVAQQNRAFSQGSQATSEETLIATPTEPQQAVEAESDSDGRLQVISEANPEDANKVEQLENDLAISQDEVDRLSRQNDLLNSRIADLEQSLTDMQRLIDMQSETGALLAATPEPAVAEGDVVGGDVVEGSIAEGSIVEGGVVSDEAAVEAPLNATESEEVSTSDQASSEPVVEPTPQPVLATPAPIAQIPEPEMGVIAKGIAWLTGNLLNAVIVVLGLFAVIGGVFTVISRRRQEEDLEELEDNLDDFDELESDGSQGLDEDVSADDEPEQANDVDEDNPFSNTEMYLAFGHFDQAMDELDAVEERGVSAQLVDQKRLEVLAEAGLRDRFEVIAHRVDMPTEQLSALEAKLAENEVALPESSDDVDLSMDFGAESETSELQFDETDEADETLSEAFDFDTPAATSAESDGLGNIESAEVPDLSTGMDLTEDQLDYSFEQPEATESEPEIEAPEADELSFDFDSAVEESSPVESAPVESTLEESADDLGMAFEVPEDLPAASDDLGNEFAELDAGSELESFDMDLGDLTEDGQSQAATDEPVEQAPSAEWEAPELNSIEEADEQLQDAEVDMGLDFGELDADFDALSSELEDSLNEPVQVSDSAPESLDESSDDDFGILSSADEFGTKLDLARAYVDMEDVESARDILQEVLADGDADQKAQAQSLLAELN